MIIQNNRLRINFQTDFLAYYFKAENPVLILN